MKNLNTKDWVIIRTALQYFHTDLVNNEDKITDKTIPDDVFTTTTKVSDILKKK